MESNDTNVCARPRPSLLRRPRRAGLAAAVASACLFTLAPASNADDVRAVWKSQAIHFEYVGRTTAYSCGTLVAKIRQVLGAIGVRDVNVAANSCRVNTTVGEPTLQIASLQVDFSSPAPATPLVMRELAKDAGRRELLQRLGAPVRPTQEFPAVWQTVDLAADRHLRLGSGDCELLRQLTRQVFKKIAVEVVARDSSCSASPQRLSKPKLKLRTLTPADGNADYGFGYAGLQHE